MWYVRLSCLRSLIPNNRAGPSGHNRSPSVFLLLNFMLFRSFMVKDVNHEEREEFEGGKILRPLCLGGSPVRSAARMILPWRAPPRTADPTPEATEHCG